MQSVSVLARAIRGIVTVALSALRHIATRPAMTAAPPVQRETVALSLVAVLTVALVRRRRAAWTSGSPMFSIPSAPAMTYECR